MTKREQAAAWLAVLLVCGITGYSAYALMGTGTLSWHRQQPETIRMGLELLLMWGLFLFLFRVPKWKIRWGGIGAAVLVFCWLHVIFFPVVLAGFYGGYLVLAGRFVTRKIGNIKLSLTWEFVLGCCSVILMFCLASLFGIGSISFLRLLVAGSGLFFLCIFFCPKKTEQPLDRKEPWPSAAMKAAILTLLLLQAGRMNLAVDFDSIWYGVRSQFMLNSGGGIYENLGTLGVVYTYSKGWEVLTLPLAGLPSYSFPVAFNLLVAAFLLVAAYETACICLKKQGALWVPFLMAAIPGIMNMAVTAKADLLTVFCQVMMIQGILRYQKERQLSWLLLGLSAGGLSLACKPTAVVYSPAIVGIAGLWIGFHWKQKRNHPAPQGAWCFPLLSAAALAGIWGRTLHLVGVPVTSVFYQLFQTLGFQIRYPFYPSGFPSAGSSLTLAEKLVFFGQRLYGILLNPQGEDMAHAVIAWGTVMPLVFAVLWLLFRKTSEIHRAPLGFLGALVLAVTGINGISLYALSQIDGNYYMLAYVLVILAGCIWLDGLTQKKQQAAKGLLTVSWLYGASLCMVTNWAWSLGFTPMQTVHQGYENHMEIARGRRAAQGSEAIWNLLAANPKNRVIALGEHPGVLTFPCTVQSYVDVSGYWGNPEVVASAPAFLEYLQFANIDYLYMEKEYLDGSVRIYQIIRTLVEEGWLWDVRSENGNLILCVRKEHPDLTDVVENLMVFDHQYIQHP